MGTFSEFFQSEFGQSITLSCIEGLFGLLSTLVACGLAWVVYSRHLKKAQAESTALAALLELKSRSELEMIYCRYIDAENPSSAKMKVRKLGIKEGVRTSNAFSPQRLESKIASYERKTNRSLPSLYS
ncbi:hypothetical protein [Vibrio agarivorans]|uniref:hypothetical protein n=1 Tax=Vibrio agarivorans TaxID=153622 RepID=UPI0025B4001B|nr:hypothetical protein [Vibrio agarivorans]MDN3661138.1 hypothetical protein [Vibrio agarivorans]